MTLITGFSNSGNIYSTMFHLLVLLIILNLFLIIDAKSFYPKDESIKKPPMMIRATPILMAKKTIKSLDITQNSKRCNVVVLPKWNWLTAYSLAKSGHKFQQIRTCKDIAPAKTTTLRTTTESTTISTTTAVVTAAEAAESTMTLFTTSVANAKNPLLLKEVCLMSYALQSLL